MTTNADLRLDAASAIGQGRREYQEDAIVSDFPIGGEIGIAVVADGMGGHAAGDVASRIAVTEVYGELKYRAADPDRFLRHAPHILREAAEGANACIAGHIHANEETRGMGTTLIALAVARSQLFWVSVGDSPLFLFRDGQLRRINEDHSLAPQIDGMVKMGMISAEDARTHPDRNCLTSALCGSPISHVDCPEAALDLAVGDIVVAGSDGLSFIDDERIREIVSEHRRDSSAEIAKALIAEIEAISDPAQDNVCFTVIRAVAYADRLAGIPKPRAERGRARQRAATPARRYAKGRSWWPAPLAARLFLSLGKHTT